MSGIVNSREFHTTYTVFAKNFGEKKFFISLEVFVVFKSTKVNSREKKRNKQDLFFILPQKSSKYI